MIGPAQRVRLPPRSHLAIVQGRTYPRNCKAKNTKQSDHASGTAATVLPLFNDKTTKRYTT